MLLNILCMVFGVVVSALWIFLPLKKVPEGMRIGKNKYVISIIIGATVCTAVIAVLETLFDDITGLDNNKITTLSRGLIYAFLRAALIEESIKFAFVKKRIKRLVPQGKLQYMLVSGAIGMGYGITEKLIMASGVAMIFDAVFALHIMFQFVMGAFLYKADQTEDKKQKTVFNIMAFAVPFVLHGVWDGVFFGTTPYIDPDRDDAACVISVILNIAAAVTAIVLEIRTAVRLRNMEVPDESRGIGTAVSDTLQNTSDD